MLSGQELGRISGIDFEVLVNDFGEVSNLQWKMSCYSSFFFTFVESMSSLRAMMHNKGLENQEILPSPNEIPQLLKLFLESKGP